VAASHQEVEIPLETAKVIQHDLHEVACGCGRVHRAAARAGTGAPGTVTYGLALQAWCVYLMAAHAIPVHRCAELIEALTGAEPSPGFVHSMIARAAAAVAAANRAIRCLIILAHVICADETPVRVGPGPKARKRYLLVACTHLLTCYFLGDRSLKTFTAFVLPDMDGTVVVHDRYQNYDAIPGLIHQLCCQHLLRDLEDTAQEYPAARWPAAITQALQGLIHAANAARAQGQAAVPEHVAASLIHAFRHGVLVGLSQVPRIAGRKQRPGRDLLECLRDRQVDELRFSTDLRILPASNQAERDLRPARPSRRLQVGSAPSRPPGSGTPSAATYPPPPSTATTSSPPSTTPSPETPGCRPSPNRRRPRPHARHTVPARQSHGRPGEHSRREQPSGGAAGGPLMIFLTFGMRACESVAGHRRAGGDAMQVNVDKRRAITSVPGL
jgi:transposase